MHSESDFLSTGTVLTRYRVERRLGGGGMGEVYRALDVELQRPVALKILSRATADSLGTAQAIRKQLLREARLACSLNHPGIVTIHSVERSDNLEFIVMEYVEGETLRDLLRDGPLPLERIRDIGADIAEALACAHGIGLIHRDIKPANLMVTRSGQVKVLDFGLAKSLAPSGEEEGSLETTRSEITSLNVVKGTVPYMSPEQTRAEPLDARSDLFSLGSVLYECATGRRAFPGIEPYMVIRAIGSEEPIPPSRLRPELDPALDLILAKAMAKDRAHRYSSGLELARALRSLGHGQPSPTPAAHRAPAPAANGAHNLPPQLTSFVGRESEITSIKDLLGSSRLVTLTGAGGCGKTRLAVRVAQDLVEECPDGVWFVDLAPLSDPSLVPDVTAAVLSIREEGGKPLLETLADHLIDKSLLLVLDNCEHVVSAVVALVSPLLYACPGLRILTTSRNVLRVPGEFVWRTPSLSIPPEGGEEPWQELKRYESVQLFLARAEAAHAQLQPLERNARAVALLCRQLDGIPLAIELAAGRAAALTPQEILGRLQDRFRLLEGREYGSPRQRTLRGAIDWSYELLTAEERLLFQRLGVFAGSFGLKAAEAICPGGGVAMEEVLSLLVRLFEQSLVFAESDPSGIGRYRLPETLRAYARERLRESGMEDSVWRRHREYFLALVESAEPELQGPDQASWLDRLGLDYEDIRVALRSSLEAGDGAMAGRFCGALRRFWWVRGMWTEGRARIREALEIAAVQDGSLGPASAVTPEARIKMLLGGAILARGQGAYGEAEALLSDGLALAREQSDSRSAAMLLHELANIENERGDLGKARSLYDQSLALWRKLADKRGMSGVLHNLGVVAESQKDYRAAQRLYEESLAVQRELGNRAWEASGLNGLGSVAIARSDWETARARHEQALSIQKDLGDRWGMAYSLRGLGTVAERTGDLKQARDRMSESLRMLRDLGDREGVAESLESLAVLAVTESQHDRALRLAGAALALRESIGSPLVPSDRERMEERLRKARQALGKQEASHAIAEGRLLAFEQAVRYGLE
jgi:predicted ATPase